MTKSWTLESKSLNSGCTIQLSDFNFLKDFIYLFLERGEGKERGKETSMCGCLSHAPYWDMAYNPGMCPDWEYNLPPFGSQAGTQSTEPHQPGLAQ